MHPPQSTCHFYFEALCILSALEHVKAKAKQGSKIIIHTDNSNTVDIFWTLHCLPPYNQSLKTAVNIIMCNKYFLHVLHIPGDENIIVNALSCVCFLVTLQLELEPTLTLFSFQPPRLVGSALWFQILTSLVNQHVKPGPETSLSKNVQSLLDKLLSGDTHFLWHLHHLFLLPC